jgi:hypothetical protein
MSEHANISPGGEELDPPSFENWALVNRICMEPSIGGRNRDFESYIAKRKVDAYSAANAEHLLIYARDIAHEPIEGFEKHIMTNEQVAQDYLRFKEEWDRKNGGGGTGGLMKSLFGRIATMGSSRAPKVEPQKSGYEANLAIAEKLYRDHEIVQDLSKTQFRNAVQRMQFVEELLKLGEGARLDKQWVADGVQRTGSYFLEQNNLVLVRDDGEDDYVWEMDQPYHKQHRKSQMKLEEERQAAEEAARKEREAAAAVERQQATQRRLDISLRNLKWSRVEEQNLVAYLLENKEGIEDTMGSHWSLSEDQQTVIKRRPNGEEMKMPVEEKREREAARLEDRMRAKLHQSRGMSMGM